MVGAVVLYWDECLLVVSACESLHVCAVCIWHSEHSKVLCGNFYAPYI